MTKLVLDIISKFNVEFDDKVGKLDIICEFDCYYSMHLMLNLMTKLVWDMICKFDIGGYLITIIIHNN